MSRFLGNKAVFAVLIALFLAVSLGGVFSVDMMGGGTAYNCPYMGVPVLCAMSPLQHLSEWQNTFAAVTQQMATEAILFLVLFGAALFVVRLPAVAPVRTGILDHAPPLLPQKEKAIRWLSLFENSPSQT